MREKPWGRFFTADTVVPPMAVVICIAAAWGLYKAAGHPISAWHIAPFAIAIVAFALVALFLTLPWRRALVYFSAVFLATASYAAYNPAVVGFATSIVNLQALGAASPLYPDVVVSDQQGAGMVFVWTAPGSAPGGACTADSGTVFQATGVSLGTGCWVRQYTGPFHAIWFNGSDIGAKANAAYTALPSFGGTIIGDPPVTGGCWDYTTPITFTTLNKPIMFIGSAPGGYAKNAGFCLNYTPTSGAAVTIDTVSTVDGQTASSAGLQNITIWNNNCQTTGGCVANASTFGIDVGTTYAGDAYYTYTNVTVGGFGTCYREHSANFITAGETWISPMFSNCTIAMTMENSTQKFISGTWLADGKIFVAPATAIQSELYFIGSTFFDNNVYPNFDYTAAVGHAGLNMDACHIESTFHANVIEGNVNLNMTGCLLEYTRSGLPASYFIKTSDNTIVNMTNITLFAQSTMTTVVDATNLVTGTLSGLAFESFSNLSTAVSGTNSSGFNTCNATLGGNPRSPCAMAGGASLFGPLRPLANTYANIVSQFPCTVIAEKGNVFIVLDSTTASSGGTISGGGSSIVFGYCTGAGGVYIVIP